MRDKKRFVYNTQPHALSENMIVGANYRFTVLTPSLIRMEYSEQGVFEDRASQSVFFRDFPANEFSVLCRDGIFHLETEQLIITYKEKEIFSADTLDIKLKSEPASTWHFGDDFEDLGGTARTLDEANGSIPLERGVCSRNGFSVLDDSKTMLLNEQGWVEVRMPNTVDCYFFGYGFRYLDAVKDFYRLTGRPPMLPAYALGNWWSRYHRYTQEEYQALIERFEEEQVPFSVSVIDMDWHITDIPEELRDEDPRFSDGWTGYTWNKELFPNYKAFLHFLKEHHLKTALNLHPAVGVCCHEEMYEEMANACGIVPASRKRVPLDVLSPEFMEKYFDILHHPYEEDGVDFWWMDWQQGTSYWWIHDENRDGVMKDEREVLDPLWMLNHLHIADIKRNGKRPMFFSRYSGPGSHRYPVGFSGDTITTWESLKFQPYFTATASNIGYSWWSHDIGGHMGGYRDDEMIVRWIQLGVFSPINRLHSSSSEYIRKEPWCFEEKTGTIMKEWLRLRHQLFPYIYTMNYRNHTELEPLVQPMYYAYPKHSAAYEAKNQFFFGSELMVAPITTPNNRIIQLGSTEVWMPEGEWFDFFKGVRYNNDVGCIRTIHRSIWEYPVFAKAGAIVPMQNAYDLQAGNDLNILIFPGKDNQFTLYEDGCDGSEFQEGVYAETNMILTWGTAPCFNIKPAKGCLSLLPQMRTYHLVFRGYSQHLSAKVRIDGKDSEVVCRYDEQTYSFIVDVTAKVSSEISVTLEGESMYAELASLQTRCAQLLQKAQISMEIKHKVDDIVRSQSLSTQKKLLKIYFACANGVEYNALVEALKEQIYIE